ncbi:MAG: autotransporter-associated beta strand repeat-containing protein [Kiritimatiellales bacterium]|jgi:autotransporter-associated beta strand protein
MKKKILSLIVLIAGLCFTAQAASSSWNVDASGNWIDTANWAGGNIPGVFNATASGDTATFTNALTAPVTVTVDSFRAISNIVFGSTSANGFTIGGGTIRMNDKAGIYVLAGTGTHDDTISSAISLRGLGNSTFTFRNDSAGSTGGLVISGNISSATPNTANTFTINLDGVSAKANNAISGVISDGGSTNINTHVAVVKNGTGQWTLQNNNNFAGGLTVNAGTLRYFGAGKTVFGAGLVTINDGVTFNKANNTAPIINNAMKVNGNFTFRGDSNNNIWSGPMDLAAGTRTITVNANLGISGVISNGSLIAAGTKILTLSGANTLDSMTVSTGTLLVDGDSSGSGALTVASGATVGGNGTVSDLVLQDGAQFLFDAAATLTANGTSVDLGNLSVASLDGAAVANGIYTLIDGTAAFDFTSVQNLGLANAADIGGGKSAYFQQGSLDLVVIPEPATIGMLGLGALLTIMLRRIRTR